MQKYHRDNEKKIRCGPWFMLHFALNNFDWFAVKTINIFFISILLYNFLFKNLMNGSVKIITTVDLGAHFINAIKIIS